MRLRFSNLPILYRILLSTTVAITVLFAIAGEIVLSHISRTLSDTLDEEVQSSFQVYTALLKSREEMLSSASRLLATLPDVRLAFGTGDRATIRDTANEFWSKVSTANPVFLVTDPAGKVIASLGGVMPGSMESKIDVVGEAVDKFSWGTAERQKYPNQASGFFLRDGELYHLSLTPVYVDSTRGEALLNVLVTGYQVDPLVAQDLKKGTNSEFLFVTPGRVIASTLNPRATAAVVADAARDKDSERVSDGVMQYAKFVKPLLDIGGKQVGEIYILRSFEGARKRIAGLYTNIILLWLIAIAGGFALTYLLASRIVRPVRQLDKAAAEVARQNYAIEVDIPSSDEMGRLARTFNNMCASIRQAREDLIRQERINTIGRLSGSIVHDLRNPLAAIYGGAEMLVDADLPPAHVKRLAANIYRASRVIQELLQDLLNTSRGRTQAAEVCRLREVASAACDSLAAIAAAQRVTVELNIPPEIEVPLERSRMERAFVNLVGNALEAMPEGGEVRISAAMEEDSVVVRVQDTGPGIAPEIRSQLFEPFVTAGKRNGLGLGLALSRQTVLDHGGDMWVESEPGKGACFLFRLPGAHIVQQQGLPVS